MNEAESEILWTYPYMGSPVVKGVQDSALQGFSGPMSMSRTIAGRGRPPVEIAYHITDDHFSVMPPPARPRLVLVDPPAAAAKGAGDALWSDGQSYNDRAHALKTMALLRRTELAGRLSFGFGVVCAFFAGLSVAGRIAWLKPEAGLLLLSLVVIMRLALAVGVDTARNVLDRRYRWSAR